MIEPITFEEFERALRASVERARRENPPELFQATCKAKPIDPEKLMEMAPGPIYDGFEEDVRRMRRGLPAIGPRVPGEPRE
jgi:hypothetical protein